jgi:rhodanese-related sulfurtransferase
MPNGIDRHEVGRLLAEEHAQLVEVLPAVEFEEESTFQAINIPLKELNREAARQLDRQRPVIMYCHDHQ